jgi:AcrR family transcriptional regulator
MSSLRERKFAKTRLTLAGALGAALESATLDEVPVKALCQEAEVSEATFFNYFPNKQALLEYLVQLWIVELNRALASADSAPGLARIQALFARCAQTCRDRPGFMKAVIAWLGAGGDVGAERMPGALECALAFPDRPDVADAPVVGIDRLLAAQVEQAFKRQQLPDNIPVPMVIGGLLALLFGVPLTMLSHDPGRVGSFYQQQLHIFWAGLRSAAVGQAAAVGS